MSELLSAWAADGAAIGIALAAAALVGAGLGALVAALVGHARAQRAETQAAERAQQLVAARRDVDTLRSRLVALERERATLEAQRDHARSTAAEKLALLGRAEQQLREAFTALSTDALRANSQSFLELAKTTLGEVQRTATAELTARQVAIDGLVKPVGEALRKLDEQLRAVETARHGHYSELRQQLEQVAQSHQLLHGETRNLVQALRAPAVRGRWGEVQLRRVVELAGMLEHCDFTEQQSADTEDGRLRPDLVVQLPGGRHVVVDAKAPLDAYLDAIGAADDGARDGHLRRHAQQVRDHMAKLGTKQYWTQFQPSPDFVVMFLPGEPFFAAALEHDPELIDWGARRNVIVASPTTLIALLRAVAYGWQQEAVARNAEEIRQLGRELHERITTMADHFTRLGQRLGDAVGAYNATLGSFEARVLVSARKLKELGAGSNAELPAPAAIETEPRALRSGAEPAESESLPSSEPGSPDE